MINIPRFNCFICNFDLCESCVYRKDKISFIAIVAHLIQIRL